MTFIAQQVFDHAADYREREDEQIEVQFMAECLYDIGREMGMETTEEYLNRMVQEEPFNK